MDPAEIDSEVEFPSLDHGVTLLSADDRATGALQSLVLDHLLLNDGDAYWVDSRNNATTTTLAKIAPSRRILDRIQVARAFTPFQHYSIVADLPGEITDSTSMIVLPAVEWFYSGDELHRGEGAAMLEGVLDTVSTIAAQRGIPVVISRHSTDRSDDIIDDAVDTEIECTFTQFGPRFSGSEFETLLFDCGTGVQTTLAFWQRVLRARQSQLVGDASPEVTPIGSH